MNEKDLNILIQLLLEGEISPHDLSVLQHELATNPAARERYLEMVEIHSLLWNDSVSSASPAGNVVPMQTILKREKLKTLRKVILATAAIVTIGLVAMAFFVVDSKPSSIAFKTSRGTDYKITHQTKDSDVGSFEMREGSTLELTQGAVELTFDSGVHSVITAPAKLTYLGDNELKLSQGTAWFEVPNGAEGFTVRTKDLDIVDLGTEFGVIAKPDDHDEVHVFTGKVEVTSKRAKPETHILTQGEACTISPTGKLLSTPVEEAHFTETLPASLRYIHWSFDKIEDNSFIAVSHSSDSETISATPRKTNAKNMQIKGAFGKAASFTGLADQDLISNHPGFDPQTPFTICYWLKMPTHRNQIKYTPLFSWAMPDTHSRLARWGFYSSRHNDGNWTCEIPCSGVNRFFGPIQTEQWHHVSFIYTGSVNKDLSPELDCYVDGRQVTKLHITPDKNYYFTDSSTEYFSQPLTIGVGLPYKRLGYTQRGAFQIDELYFIEGALTKQQINNLKDSNTLP